MRWLPIVFLFFIGCSRPAPIAPETDGQGAARVFALAQDLDTRQKTKQAIAAYRQVVLHFPNTPEAKKAAQRISESQRDAIRKAAARKSK